MNTRQNRGPQTGNRDLYDRFGQNRRRNNKPVNRENFQGYRNEHNEDFGYYENDRNREFENYGNEEERFAQNRRLENRNIPFDNRNREEFGNMGNYTDQPDDERDYYDTGSYRHQGRNQGYFDQGFDDNGQNGNRYGQYDKNNRVNPGRFGNNPYAQRNRGFENMERPNFGETGRRGSSQPAHWPEDQRAFEEFDQEPLEEQDNRTSRRGFASMDPEQVREIARMGGLSSHSGSGARSQAETKKKTGTSRRGFASMDPEKVRKIARLGGLSSHKNDGRNTTASAAKSARRTTATASASKRTRITSASASSAVKTKKSSTTAKTKAKSKSGKTAKTARKK